MYPIICLLNQAEHQKFTQMYSVMLVNQRLLYYSMLRTDIKKTTWLLGSFKMWLCRVKKPFHCIICYATFQYIVLCVSILLAMSYWKPSWGWIHALTMGCSLKCMVHYKEILLYCNKVLKPPNVNYYYEFFKWKKPLLLFCESGKEIHQLQHCSLHITGKYRDRLSCSKAV